MNRESPVCRVSRVFPDSFICWRHVAGCADCQEFFSGTSALEAELMREAREGAAAPSIGFERRLATAVRMHSATEPDRRSRFLIQGAFAAVAAIVIMFAVGRNPANPGASGTLAASASAETQVVIDAVGKLGARAWSSILSAGQFVESNPLQEELRLVFSNAQVAYSFLRRNFVPDAFTAPPANG